MYQILATAHFLGAMACTVHLLLRYRRPVAAVAWLFGLWVVFLLGPLWYLLFALPGKPRAMRRRAERALALRGTERRSTLENAEYPDSLPRVSARLAHRLGAFPLTAGNEVSIHPSGDAAFDAMLEAIAQAREEICLLSFILTEGRIGHELQDALNARAAAGVRVCLLYDGIGSKSLSRRYLEGFQDVRHAVFAKPSLIKGRFQLNHRNHRKILVVDGVVGFTGGQNWNDVHSLSRATGRVDRDLHVRVRGPAVAGMRRVFVEDWELATGEALPAREPPGECGDMLVRVIPHGPDEETRRLIGMVVAMIARAQEEILLVTPYFIPGEAMRELLRMAALSGVVVRLLLPERGDQRLPELAARRSFDRLLQAGVQIHLRKGPFLHAKALVVDRNWATIGSANFDQRSFFLNYEMNLEIADHAFAQSLHEYFAQDLEQSERVDRKTWAQRGIWRRLCENFADLFEPLL